MNIFLYKHLILASAVFVIIGYVINRIFQYWIFVKKIKKLPNSKIHPFFGDTPAPHIKPYTMFVQIYDGLCKLYSKEGMVVVWILFHPVIILFSDKSVNALMNHPRMLHKSDDYKFLKEWLREGLLLSWGKKWKGRRKLMTPSFHFRTLAHFQPIIDHRCSEHLSKWKQHLQRTNILEIKNLINDLSIDIITESVMGQKQESQEPDIIKFKSALSYVAKAFLFRIQKPWLWPQFIFNRSSTGKLYQESVDFLNAYGMKVISTKKQLIINDGLDEVEKGPLLDMLLRQHIKDPTFTETDVLEEVNTFMFAGADTTGANITMALYMLGLHLDVQEKVHDEIKSILGDDHNKEITMDDIKEMKYLEQVIKETQRLFPPALITGRQITEDLQIGDYKIPKGTTAWVNYKALHNDPEYFPEPEHFDPDRFSPENSKGRNPMAFIPFSAGPRNCIGQKIASMILKTTLVHCIRAFELQSIDPRDKVMLVNEIVLKPAEEVKIRIKHRETYRGNVHNGSHIKNL